MTDDTRQATRLNKFLALALGLSRRQADDLIASGDVTIDDQTASLGARFDPAHHTVFVGGKKVASTTKFRYVAFNKPIGYVCSRRAQGDAPTIYDLLPSDFRALKPVGRLDKNSSGLILLTNDGDFAHTMTHPSFHKTKHYEVRLDHPLQPLHRQMISDFGVMLEDGKSKFEVSRVGLEDGKWKTENSKAAPTAQAKRVATHGVAPASSVREGGADVSSGPASSDLRADFAPAKSNDGSGKSKEIDSKNNWIPDQVGNDNAKERVDDDTRWVITMSEGRNRQIRRTFAALGYEVVGLHRTQFGTYQLNGLKPGKFTDVSI